MKTEMIIIIGIIAFFILTKGRGSFTGRGLHGDYTVRDDQGNVVGII